MYVLSYRCGISIDIEVHLYSTQLPTRYLMTSTCTRDNDGYDDNCFNYSYTIACVIAKISYLNPGLS